MGRQGEVFDNPVTGEYVVALTDPDEQAEGVLVAQLTVRPGGRVASAHDWWHEDDGDALVVVQVDPGSRFE